MEVVEQVLDLLDGKFSKRDQVEIVLYLCRGVVLRTKPWNFYLVVMQARTATVDQRFAAISEQVVRDSIQCVHRLRACDLADHSCSSGHLLVQHLLVVFVASLGIQQLSIKLFRAPRKIS